LTNSWDGIYFRTDRGPRRRLPRGPRCVQVDQPLATVNGRLCPPPLEPMMMRPGLVVG
jgi:hypothetical protein